VPESLSPLAPESFVRRPPLIQHGKNARGRCAWNPYHITQRGNARQVVFDHARDRRVYLSYSGTMPRNTDCNLGWCLMKPCSLLAVPTADSMKRTLARTIMISMLPQRPISNLRPSMAIPFYSCHGRARNMDSNGLYRAHPSGQDGATCRGICWSSARRTSSPRPRDLGILRMARG